MHTIQTEVKVNKNHILNIALPDDIAEGTYKVVIVMSSQPENTPEDHDTPDEVILEGIKEGLKQAFSDQTIPISQIWEGIDVE
ncbi:type II toxin-antitoxin system RelN family antitoxin [Crocosphaera sp. Alani8]|uniref:type II toxin-antitoxin system RelN family antitoxin n=1 Tax=Crocosphaera sp. Alani8 TaxID=3038952 RepID=UPI00313D595D